MADRAISLGATEPDPPVPDFVPLLRKILEKTEAGRIEWTGDPKNYSYSAVFKMDDGFYSIQIHDDGGMPGFAVRDQSGESVFEWDYELEDEPGLELADRVFKAAAENYVRRANNRIRQLVEGINKL